jgi:UDP-3-O-[3-hydroxymyristoyl] N-acetylglucosamine deacetylase
MDGLAFPVAADGVFSEAGTAPQCTLKAAISCVGVGLHTGQRVSLSFQPAPVDHGIVFRRADLGAGVPARFDRVVDTRLCTVLEQDGVRVGTVEHVMAALVGCGIDNAVVELDGPEPPIFDGSAAQFVFLLDCAGKVVQDTPRPVVEILRPVRVNDADGFAELRPGPIGLDMALSIDFAAAAIGRQALSLRLTPESFRHELSRARTFTLVEDIDRLRATGLAQGGSLDNAVVVDQARVLNPAGLRAPDEFVRHKLLDAVGDLALAGVSLRGRFIAHRSGHTLNNRLLRALFADRAAWREVEAAPLAIAAE